MWNSATLLDLLLNLYMVISFIWVSYGLFILARKMNIKHAWIGIIPIAQYYTMTKTAGVSFKKYALYPILIIIALIIIWVIVVPLYWEKSWVLLAIMIAFIVAYIYYLVRFINILSGISRKTWRGWWTTCGLFFVPFIMFPLVAHKFDIKKIEKNKKEVEL